MKRLLPLLALAAATTTAQAAPPPPAWATLTAREERIGLRLDRGVRDGQIPRAEAARLRRQLHRIESLRAYYRRSHGMSAWERRDLERRLKTIDARIEKDRAPKREPAKAEAATPEPAAPEAAPASQ